MNDILNKLNRYIEQEDLTFGHAITRLEDYLNNVTGCDLYGLDDEYVNAALDDLLVHIDIE